MSTDCWREGHMILFEGWLMTLLLEASVQWRVPVNDSLHCRIGSVLLAVLVSPLQDCSAHCFWNLLLQSAATSGRIGWGGCMLYYMHACVFCDVCVCVCASMHIVLKVDKSTSATHAHRVQEHAFCIYVWDMTRRRHHSPMLFWIYVRTLQVNI